MAGTFAILLTFATLATGIFWCLEKFKWKPARQRKVESVRQQTDGNIDGKLLAEIGKPNGFLEGLASFFPVLFVVFVIRSFIFEPFQIPSGSMMQTLLIGDFIIVNKYSYGLRNPLTNNVMFETGKPQRGDVAVFKDPENPSRDLIKRVIGLPGDKIVYSVNTKQVLIYPACTQADKNCNGQNSQPLDLKYSELQSSNWKEVYKPYESGARFYTLAQYNQANDLNLATVLEIDIAQETICDVTHNILVTPNKPERTAYFYRQAGQPVSTWIVPANNYFMMGDNRDNSADSRYFGFAPEQNFVGKASAIWMSFEKQPDEWPTGIRFSRIGGIH